MNVNKINPITKIKTTTKKGKEGPGEGLGFFGKTPHLNSAFLIEAEVEFFLMIKFIDITKRAIVRVIIQINKIFIKK